MQAKHAKKMTLGFTFALLLTLQSLWLVSSQTPNPWNGAFPPSTIRGIPDEWKRENGLNPPEEDLGISSGSMTFSGDGEYLSGNQTVIPVRGQNDDNINTTPSAQTIPNGEPTKIIVTSTQQPDMSNPVTLNPNLGHSTTNGNHVDLTETNTTTPTFRNSTTTTTNITTTSTSAPVFNITQNSTLSYTNSPTDHSTNSTVFMTTMLNYTSGVLPNESSTASTTKWNGTGGSLDVRGNLDRELSSNIQQQVNSQAWGAVLGIGVAVAIVALVVYIIVKRRNYRDFSHRKLVEDMPPEPVLRLDNSEPLDLKFDGFAYYNAGLQTDNIQMTNFPRGQAK